MPAPRRYTEADVREAVASSPTMAAALAWLGLRAAGGNYGTLHRLIALYGLSTGHMDPNASTRRARAALTPLEDVLVAGSNYSRRQLKRRLYAAGLKQPRCELCGQGEEWHGRHMSLILDHVNGEHDDNRLENLRIVCPNCNATLDTHCGRKNRAAPKECVRCGASFLPRSWKQRYCSQACGMRSRGPSVRPWQRKVERPSYPQLLAELEDSNFCEVARRYEVTDNAVRKWVRAYERQLDRIRSAEEEL